MSNLNVASVTATTGFNLPNFTNANRPSSGTTGQMIYNTSEGIAQVWDGLAWVNVTNFGGPFKATGGNIIDTTSMSNYTMHVFTGNGTFSVKSAPAGSTVDVLIVGGGGGGGGGANATWHGGGGGGGGQVRLLTNLAVTAGTDYPIGIGQGGGGGAGGNNPGTNGQNGEPSIFGSYSASGGGGGDAGLGSGQGNSGGSGGGEAAGGSPTGGGFADRAFATNDFKFGHRGGRWYNSGAAGGDPYGSGGGGAGAAGHYTAQRYAGTGGHGIDLSTVFGTSYGESGVFAGGGGGGGADDDSNYNSNNQNGFKAQGGPGGGGDGGGGGNNNGSNGFSGDANTGGGGGGGYGGTPQYNGGQGGSGVVIVRYRTTTAYTPLLGDPGNPASSARAIKTARPTAPDGIYWITTSFGGAMPFWCDMTTDGGGWILVYKNGNWPNQGCSNGNYFEFPRNSASGGGEPPLSVLGDAEWTGSMYRHVGLSPSNRGSLWSSTGATNYAMSGHSMDAVYGDRAPNQGTGTYKTVFFIKGITTNSNWNNGSNIWAYFCGGTAFSNPPGNGFPNQSLGTLGTGIGTANATSSGSTYEISSLGNYACNCCEGYYTNTSWGGIQWFGDGYGVNNASATFAQTTNFWIK